MAPPASMPSTIRSKITPTATPTVMASENSRSTMCAALVPSAPARPPPVRRRRPGRRSSGCRSRTGTIPRTGRPMDISAVIELAPAPRMPIQRPNSLPAQIENAAII